MNDHTISTLQQLEKAALAVADQALDLAKVARGVWLALTIQANQGGTEQADTSSAPTLLGAQVASVVALPVAPVGDETSGASTTCPYGVTWCPDRHGHVCPDCAEFGNDAA